MLIFENMILSFKSLKIVWGQWIWNKFFEVAELVFGEDGFYVILIGDIICWVSVVLGIFYVYFDLKDEIFWVFVVYMGYMV